MSTHSPLHSPVDGHLHRPRHSDGKSRSRFRSRSVCAASWALPAPLQGRVDPRPHQQRERAGAHVRGGDPMTHTVSLPSPAAISLRTREPGSFSMFESHPCIVAANCFSVPSSHFTRLGVLSLVSSDGSLEVGDVVKGRRCCGIFPTLPLSVSSLFGHGKKKKNLHLCANSSILFSYRL